MKLTKEIIEQGKSSNNGWNNEQMIALGVTSFTKGWMKALVGKEVTQDAIDKFLSLKDYHFKRRLANGGKVKTKVKQRMGKFDFVPVSNSITYNEQYLHPNWQKFRLFVLNRDNYKCVNCGSVEKTLHAHHLKYARGKFIWEVPHWYIVTLCEDCHSLEHGRDLTAK